MRFSTKLTGLAQTADYVEATVTNAAGESEKLRGKYLIGADGGSSTMRRLADIAFEGFTWPERFIKIGTSFDFGATGQAYCTRNYFSDPDEWINLFKVKGYGPPGIWRGAFPYRRRRSDEEALSMAGIQRRLQGIHRKSGDYEIPYYALYAVHQRVAATFNKGRLLLAGDCAHVNNPIGGMGMNGGIDDAINLAEKMARRLVRPCRHGHNRPLHPPAPQGAGRLCAGADYPEQECARRERPGDLPRPSGRIAAHLRGHRAA